MAQVSILVSKLSILFIEVLIPNFFDTLTSLIQTCHKCFVWTSESRATSIACNVCSTTPSELVMGSIKENRCRYSIDTLAKVSILVSILRYPSENPHHELHIHKLVAYFEVFRLSDFEFFRFLRHLLRFCPISSYTILDFFFGIFGHYFSDNTTIPKGIDTISHHYCGFLANIKDISDDVWCLDYSFDCSFGVCWFGRVNE